MNIEVKDPPVETYDIFFSQDVDMLGLILQCSLSNISLRG